MYIVSSKTEGVAQDGGGEANGTRRMKMSERGLLNKHNIDSIKTYCETDWGYKMGDFQYFDGSCVTQVCLKLCSTT